MPVKNNYMKDQVVATTDSYGGLLKFALVFGFLTFQGSQQALAGTDVAMQLNPNIGDVGDISTGFASVRKISLYFISLLLPFKFQKHQIYLLSFVK